MLLQNELLGLLDSFSVERQISGILSILLLVIFLLEFRKYMKYRSYPDIMELSAIGFLATGLFALTGDMLLSGLAGIMGLMIIGTYEVRENPIWVRMMGTFTVSYGFFFIMVAIGFVSTNTIPSLGDSMKNFLTSIGFSDAIEIQQFFVGVGYNLIIWVMVFTAFLLFGRKFIVVTRFISPQMTYLVLYLVAILLITQLDLDNIVKYPAIFLVNCFIYLISGYLLTFLYGIKPLNDERVQSIVSEVQQRIDTPIRKIGIVEAPILNAFAFGPWFDQRIAYIASDLDQFTDAEIRGITAHELAHVQKKHTMILLGITALELVVKFIIEAPATYWEYVLSGVQTWDFLSFWLFNIGLFAILLTFVKMLEGQADKITRQKGYGIELAESLYRLEGFYYGIAGEIGFNTQLMTGKKRTKDENIRFMGDQAYYLYQNLAPSRMTCFMNLIASHPLTSVRIAMQTDYSIGMIRAGLMTWTLLIPGLRGRSIRRLQKSHEEMALILSKKYSRDFGNIKDYLEITYEEESAEKIVNHHVLAKPKLKKDTALWGKVVEYKITGNIVSPIELELKMDDDTNITIQKSDYDFVIADPDQEYFMKSGKKATLVGVEITNGKFKKFIFSYKNKKILSKSIGLSLIAFEKTNYWFLYKNGSIQPWTLKDAIINDTFQNSSFLMEDDSQTEHHLLGKDLIVDLPPQIQMIKSRNWELEKHFFSRLKQLNESFTLYDKEDFDIGSPTKVLSISGDMIEFLEGRTTKKLAVNKVDALVLNYPFYFFNLRSEMGIGNILSLKMFNRGTQNNYIGL
ncbi:MAG: M48 family metallopeptidase [Candidatus Hodarchaeales archaeon]